LIKIKTKIIFKLSKKEKEKKCSKNNKSHKHYSLNKLVNRRFKQPITLEERHVELKMLKNAHNGYLMLNNMNQNIMQQRES